MHRRVGHQQQRRQRTAQVGQQLRQLLCTPSQCLQADIPSHDAGLLNDSSMTWRSQPPTHRRRQITTKPIMVHACTQRIALKGTRSAHLQQQAGELARHSQQHVQQRCFEQLDDAGVRRRDALHGMQEPGCSTAGFCGNHDDVDGLPSPPAHIFSELKLQ